VLANSAGRSDPSADPEPPLAHGLPHSAPVPASPSPGGRPTCVSLLLIVLLLILLASPVQIAPDTVPRSAEPDPAACDTRQTCALVARVIVESGEVPEGLVDYAARVRSTVQLALAPDTAIGGEMPVTVDEFDAEIRWRRPDTLHQWVNEQVTRVLVPAPYSLGSLLEAPWVIPHLYGATIDALALTAGSERARRGRPRAVHPFGPDGPDHYRYDAGDTVRIRVQSGVVTLVPITVRPRTDPPDALRPLVAGEFHIDVDRAAVARARFGFVERRRGLGIGRAGTFLELENSLWEDRYWLPFRQRREQQVSMGPLGGSVAARIVSTISAHELNTGWSPDAGRLRLFAGTAERREGDPLTPTVGEYSVDDFADIHRLATAPTGERTAAVRIRPHLERGDHLFRYNRVEGAFVGTGARIEPADPLDRRWEAYATAGWAFAESTARGEVVLRWRPPASAHGSTVGLAAYRRLADTRAFRPSIEWGWLHSLPAALAGSDPRDYYDAVGADAGWSRRAGAWRTRLGIRWEQHDSVRIGTDRYLFGEATEFGPVAPVSPGSRATAEAELAFARGSGAFGLGNGTVASLRAEVAGGSLGGHRAMALLSLRRTLEPFTLAGRVDAGHALGDVPPQLLFRLGGDQGLTGYTANEFAGSSAAVARGRLLLGVPPRSQRPLIRVGPFFVPPLRPSLVALGEVGWTHASARAAPAVELLRAATTDGAIGAWGAGVSVFDDALTLERVQPVDRKRPARWYFGVSRWF